MEVVGESCCQPDGGKSINRMVHRAGTGLVKSCTKSICPSAIFWSKNHEAVCSRNGRSWATAGGSMNGLMVRRRAAWRSPSPSAMPMGGIPSPRGIPMIPM